LFILFCVFYCFVYTILCFCIVNPICHLLALLGGATIVVVSRLSVKRIHNSRCENRDNNYLFLRYKERGNWVSLQILKIIYFAFCKYFSTQKWSSLKTVLIFIAMHTQICHTSNMAGT
jgi:hypothetical protein